MARYFLTSLVLAAAFLVAPLKAGAAQLEGPLIALNGDNIVLNSTLTLNEKQVGDISKGISKEVVFYIDLYRVWKSWPDEFVAGITVTRTLSCNPVKNEFVATSLEGNVLREKRFGNCEDLLRWTLNLEGVTVANSRELEPAEYYAKLTAESRIRKLPPVVGYLLFFVKEKEFRVKAVSDMLELKVVPEGKK